MTIALTYAYDNNPIYVTDWRPFEGSRYRARFYLDPNAIPMTSGNAHYLLYALDRNNTVLLRVEFRYYASQYQLRADTVNDSNGCSQTAWAAVSDAPHFVEVAWQAASAAGANDGVLTFWVDDSQQGSFTNIDNDTRRFDYVQFGIVGGVDNGSRGTLYFDAFESHRDTYIGPLAELLLFKLALQEAAYRAGGLLLPAWEAVVNMANAAQTVWSEFVSHFETAETVKPAAAPLPFFDEGAALQLTGVLAPVTLQASTVGIKLLAAPEPLKEDQAAAQPAPLQTAGYTTTRVIVYTYDPLYRLTRADYNDGTYFRYTYDAVGNRITGETAGATVNSYVYDIANRVTSVDGVAYTWDDNGNLLSDGIYTYTYTSNKLSSITGNSLNITFQYNGLGERVSQTVNSVTTHFTVDLNAGLSQVLNDETFTYLYGNGRIAQYDATGAQYFLGDALGSVRQLAGPDGSITLAKSYQPYGEVLGSAGSEASSYGYTGEWTNSYIELVYLRSRYYSLGTGRFLAKDSWTGDYTRPMSYNAWIYVYANPIGFIDPSGECPDNNGDGKCDPGWQCELLMDPEAREHCRQCTHPLPQPLDPNLLIESGAQKVYDTFIALRDNPGWWNNYDKKSSMTTHDMLELLLAMEFSDDARRIDVALQKQTTVRNFYSLYVYRGSWCNSKNQNAVIEYITAKDLADTRGRHLLVPKGADPGSIWINSRYRWSTVDFSTAFKAPGQWNSGWGNNRVPMDWGNLEMLSGYHDYEEMYQAKAGSFVDYPHTQYIANNEFYFSKRRTREKRPSDPCFWVAHWFHAACRAAVTIRCDHQRPLSAFFYGPTDHRMAGR